MYQTELNRMATEVGGFLAEGKRMYLSSSFQTHSIPLLHLMQRFAPEVPVYFLDTGFHFPETLKFKDEVANALGLKLISIRSKVPKLQQRDDQGNFYFSSDPDRCCFLNKTLPMEEVLLNHDLWISGVRRDQNLNRKNLNRLSSGNHGTLRYHPMLDWTAKMIYAYRKDHDLPEHPLEKKGYLSVGCEPCTSRYVDGREGRWQGMKKTECGLHTDLLKK